MCNLTEREKDDYGPPIDTGEKNTIFYRRQCAICGKIEETIKTNTVTVLEPDFG